MNPFYEKMREHIERHEQSQLRGISSRDVVASQYTESELEHLVAQLSQQPPDRDATFRLSCFIFERMENKIHEHLRHAAADNVAAYVERLHPNVDAGAIEIFVAWGGNRSDYHNICLSVLQHERSEIRGTALAYGPRFLKPRDYPTVFALRKDPEISEIAMGGPLRFVLRDQALSLLERLTGCPPSEDDCFEDKPEGRISYRSWSHFSNWYEHHRKQFTHV